MPGPITEGIRGEAGVCVGYFPSFESNDLNDHMKLPYGHLKKFELLYVLHIMHKAGI